MVNFEKELQNNIFEIIEAISDEVLVSDGKGMVLWVNSGFEEIYGIKKNDVLGQTVYEMEKRGIFKPSIIARVLEQNDKVTMTQKTSDGKEILVTATPIYNEAGGIKLVVSYSRDITEMNRLQQKYSRIRERVEAYKAELHELRKGVNNSFGVVGQSVQMEKVISTINRIADLDANVLLLGESGVGKSMLAKVIHNKSDRSDGPFIDINCAAIPENLLESELFGYEKGAFTGANANGKVGLMELANGGTLLLDEISEIPLALQAKLLKAIQEKCITRVGGVTPVKVNFRLIAASNRQLDQYAADGKFRTDLYYRLNVVNITIPPLRERKEDIVPLVEHFTELFNEKYGLKKSFAPRAIEHLTEYLWPGNIRELANAIERTIVTSDNTVIKADDLPDEIHTPSYAEGVIPELELMGLNEAVEAVEARMIRRAYEQCGTTTGVAELLKISQPTAYRKINKYVIDKNG